MMFGIPVLFLVSTLHYYGATSSITTTTPDPPQCNACCQGQPGQPGLSGNGVPGIPGVPGMPGSIGPKGDQGPVGDGGPTGPDGMPGQEGRQGEQGPLGIQGLVPPGKVGPTGPIGPDGLVGVKGEKGDLGPARIQPASAFTALKTATQNGSPGDVVTFDEMSYNLGDDFNLDTGKFTCSIAGTYVFDFGVDIQTYRCIISLSKNGNAILSRVQKDNEGTVQGGSMIQLQVGDEVWLEFTSDAVARIYILPPAQSYFNGFLLYIS